MKTNPNFLLAQNQIYHLNCSQLLALLRQNEMLVDAIITDPPYNISKKDNFFTSIGRAGRDHGSWDYGFDQITWIEEAVPLLKKGGSLIIFNDWKNLGEISRACERNGLVVKDLIRWKKTNPMPRNITRRYVTDFELALWAVKGDGWTFNYQKTQQPYLIPEYKGSVVLGKTRIHPTQKNLTVIKGIIATHTKPGDLVLDPFMGSGTTAQACQELGRNYIGSEIDTDYWEKSQLRLQRNSSYAH